MNTQYLRMSDKSVEPSQEDMLQIIGTQAASSWADIHAFLRDNYELTAVKRYWGKKLGWMIQYHRRNKTLCSLFPETGAFSVLLIFGGKELQKIITQANSISSQVLEMIENTTQLHDGKWVFIRLTDSTYVNDIKKLIMIKRKPQI